MLKKQTIKDVLFLALPAVGEMILYMTIWFFDTMMVGQYGGNLAVSTVGLSSEIIYTFINIFIAVGISVGITSIIARKFGAKEFVLAEEYASIGLFAGIITALIISLIILIFPKQLLSLSGANSYVIQNGSMFMKIISFGMFFNMLMSILNAILRGYGNTMTPLIGSAIVNIVNISLDYILIFGHFGFPSLGIKGSAIATASAQTLGFLFILVYTIKYSKIKPNIKYIKKLHISKLIELLRLSIPSSFQEGAFDISRLISVMFIMHLGTIAFASNQITTTIESLSFMPGWGFAVAATTLVGHKIGEKNYIMAKEYAYTCVILGTIVMCFCSILFLAVPNQLIRLFINESEKQVISIGSLCIMVAAVEQPFMGLSMIFGGSLKGLGDTRTPFIVSLISSWIIRVPLMYCLIFILKASVVYVWWITALQWSFDGTLMFLLFKKKFKSIDKYIKHEVLI